jgi:hypothetical protein
VSIGAAHSTLNLATAPSKVSVRSRNRAADAAWLRVADVAPALALVTWCMALTTASLATRCCNVALVMS